MACIPLSYGRGFDHLSPEQIMPLLDELGRHGAKGHWAVIDITSMYLFGGRPLSVPLADKLKSTLLAHDLFDDVSRMDGNHLEQMIKRLLVERGEKDKTFLMALVRQLLSICQPQKSNVFYALDRPVRSVITPLLASHPHEVWREVSKVLTSNDFLVRSYAERLFKPSHESHLNPGLLYGLPRDIYLDWVRKAPTERAAVVMEWLSVTTTANDGKLLETYVNEFGNQPQVLDRLAIRLRLRTWWGSVVPHLEQFLPLLEKWVQSHPMPEVRRWAPEQIRYLKAEIDMGRKQDEEHDAGIY